MWFRMRTGAQSTSIHFKPPLEVDCAEVDSIHFECALAPMRIVCEISQCALNAHSMRIGFQCEKALDSRNHGAAGIIGTPWYIHSNTVRGGGRERLYGMESPSSAGRRPSVVNPYKPQVRFVRRLSILQFPKFLQRR